MEQGRELGIEELLRNVFNSEKQIQIALLYMAGYSVEDIAYRLNVSRSYVYTVIRALREAYLRDRSGVVHVALLRSLRNHVDRVRSLISLLSARLSELGIEKLEHILTELNREVSDLEIKVRGAMNLALWNEGTGIVRKRA